MKKICTLKELKLLKGRSYSKSIFRLMRNYGRFCSYFNIYPHHLTVNQLLICDKYIFQKCLCLSLLKWPNWSNLNWHLGLHTYTHVYKCVYFNPYNLSSQYCCCYLKVHIQEWHEFWLQESLFLNYYCP